MHRALLDIHTEGRLQRQIKDIIDELDMMLHVYKKQREVMRRFCRNVEQMMDPEGRWKQNAMRETVDYNVPDEQRAAELEKRDQLLWFSLRSEELLSDVDGRVEELDGLRNAAETTARSVSLVISSNSALGGQRLMNHSQINDILTLKQQQASVVQAWESVKQGDETVRQGRSIMFFTVFTILFLPLSFMTSVFGMNNSDFGNDKLTLREEMKFICKQGPLPFIPVICH
jgi:Mg2+ and Co2+ transporter CorA